MVEPPQDPIERRKLILLIDLHQQLLSYRSALRGSNKTDTVLDINVGDELRTLYPDLPRQAGRGKTLADSIVEDWIEPKVRQALVKLDPRKAKTPTQAHKLQGVLAYYYTYAREHLSSAQIVATKLNDAQTICDTWCKITNVKRFVTNKGIEDLLIVKSPRTVQRYVTQGMADVFGITFGSARSGKKAISSPQPAESHNTDPTPNVVTVLPHNIPDGHRLSQSEIVTILTDIKPSTLDVVQVDQLISAISDAHKVATSVVSFNLLAHFVLQVDEAVYSQSKTFHQFIRNLFSYEPDSVEDRLDIVESREQLRTHPVIKQMQQAEEYQRLQSTRKVDLETLRHLCTQLTIQIRGHGSSSQESITQLCKVVANRLDDTEFTTLTARAFDQMPQSHQVALVARLLEECDRRSFDFVVSLAVRPSGAYIRSRTRYLARSASMCREHGASAQDRLMLILKDIRNGLVITTALRNEVLFHSNFLISSGLPVDGYVEAEIKRHFEVVGSDE